MEQSFAPVNPLEVVRQFMLIGGQSIQGFNVKQAGLYTGLQLEEIAEKLALIAAAEPDSTSRVQLGELVNHITVFALRFKQGYHQGAVAFADRAELLDADIDLAWVALGGAFSTSTCAPAAFAEVARANLDKYPGGVVLRDANGKIKKPEGWQGPNLLPYVEADEG